MFQNGGNDVSPGRYGTIVIPVYHILYTIHSPQAGHAPVNIIHLIIVFIVTAGKN